VLEGTVDMFADAGRWHDRHGLDFEFAA
jgi:hypothetical protein